MKRILIGAGALLLLAVPACMLLLDRPAAAPGASTAQPAAPADRRPPSVAAQRVEEPIPPAEIPQTGALPAPRPEPLPAAEPTDPLARLVQLVLPRRQETRNEDDCEIPGDPIGSTLCRMRCHLRDHPDALAERPVVHRPGVVYWHESNLVAHDF